MTCYIPKIEKPEAIYTIRIKRFDPSSDQGPHWASYEIPFVSTMTVIEALEYLWDQGEYIAFRANCREFTCGSCAMLINGQPRLACDTLLKDNMTLEPLSRYAVVKDLVVQNDVVQKRLQALEYWPVVSDEPIGFRVSPETQEEFGAIFARCIECYCCLEACLASRSEESGFDGPMYLLHIARAKAHPLDELDRLDQASRRGMWSCVSCFECAAVCPVNLSPGEIIAALRREVISRQCRRLLRLGRS